MLAHRRLYVVLLLLLLQDFLRQAGDIARGLLPLLLRSGFSWLCSLDMHGVFCRRLLKDFLRQAGDVTYANVDPDGMGVGEYQTLSECRDAIEKLTGAALDGKIVKLTALVSVNLSVKLLCGHAEQLASSVWFAAAWLA
jgi:hypothetical protein